MAQRATLPETIDDGDGNINYWRSMLAVLRAEDWDKRVRISSATHEGARVGSVASVPAIGLKLALRKAMTERAEAEIALREARDDLARFKLGRVLMSWVWFAAGGAVVGAIAALLRFGMG
ncbi:MAG: hypothetical protein JNK11_06635 [Alphaproteobacteria bacterium]|nr:hypothetical protein [Alphaproteobacteria bacterium]